jgi:hypothetical protein
VRRRLSPANPAKPHQGPAVPASPVLSLCLLLLASSPGPAVVVAEDGGGALGAVALATPAPPNKSAPVAAVIARVLRMAISKHLDTGSFVATYIALAWSTLRRDEQFHSANASRDIIGRAKGILMERFNLDAVAAFDLLSRLSQQTNTKRADIAQRLIDSEDPFPTKAKLMPARTADMDA